MNGKIGEQNSDRHRQAKTTRTGSVHYTIRHFFSETISVRVSLPTIDDVPGAAVNSQPLISFPRTSIFPAGSSSMIRKWEGKHLVGSKTHRLDPESIEQKRQSATRRKWLQKSRKSIWIRSQAIRQPVAAHMGCDCDCCDCDYIGLTLGIQRHC